jgi:hypothetical protein
LKKKSFEAKFVDSDKIIVQQVTSCGPAAQVIEGSASEQSLNDFDIAPPMKWLTL